MSKKLQFKEIPPVYPILTEQQIAKLPWNRLKNIMSMVRANIGAVNKIGWDWCEVCNDHHLDRVYFNSIDERDVTVNSILAPRMQYFELLKAYAGKLPHQKKSII